MGVVFADFATMKVQGIIVRGVTSYFAAVGFVAMRGWVAVEAGASADFVEEIVSSSGWSVRRLRWCDA